ncbi:MAG: trypsin-like peptidase domain-containing protein [Rhodobacteraceae bacterium]|nr:trypsin-like peptidase domain-containing protein [Paracoccaceae bacterium]
MKKRHILILAIVVTTTFFSSLAYSQTQQSSLGLWQKDFDAAKLQASEIEVIQAFLAFKKYYRSLIDGRWGKGSQGALERYSVSTSSNAKPTFQTVFSLLGDFGRIVEKDAWRPFYVSELDMSHMVPIEQARYEKNQNPAPYTYQGKLTSAVLPLTTSYVVGNQAETINLHGKARVMGASDKDAYELYNPDLLITSYKNRMGSVYTRSDKKRNGNWSTVIIETPMTVLVSLISSSIRNGKQPAWNLPTDGYLLKIARSATGITSKEAEADASGDWSGIQDEAKNAGSGFIVSADGHVVTTSPVVSGCAQVMVDETEYDVQATKDKSGLALLRPKTAAPVSEFAQIILFGPNEGDTVAAVGIPLAGGGNQIAIAKGAVTSTTGLGENEATQQISAKYQPGKLGGPLLNTSGYVVGVVISRYEASKLEAFATGRRMEEHLAASKLDTRAIRELADGNPKHIDFAVSGDALMNFLIENNIELAFGLDDEVLDKQSLSDRGAAITRPVRCR